jgi:hypothetical protein
LLASITGLVSGPSPENASDLEEHGAGASEEGREGSEVAQSIAGSDERESSGGAWEGKIK